MKVRRAIGTGRDTERRQGLESQLQRLNRLLVAGTAAAILLAGILTLSFTGGVSWRLQQLRDNAINLAAGAGPRAQACRSR